MNLRQRNGSALLVVLGMVAFIVISAVAFSAYMRYSRAPSSFLRQTIASRMIVKAALAEAISEIDEAIGNNPHPNIGHNRVNYEYINNQGQSTVAGTNNYWRGRVLVGGYNDLPDYDDTVATLTYEGLAYIPPALVNEARYYSRHANTAKWRSLDFDVGRYAFCAIDVSDFFDVNILCSDEARSSDPGSRITLNYLFGGGSGAKEWEDFVQQFRKETDDGISFDGKVPLVSVADLNLAMGKGSYGGLQSPFCQYDHQTALNFYGDESKTEDAAEMTFVTDGWFPKSIKNNDKYDLTDNNFQPFLLFPSTPTPDYYDTTEAMVPTAAGSPAALRLHNPGGEADFIPSVAYAALYDYLDPDHVPIALGSPTLERVPMVCRMEFTSPTLGNMTVAVIADPNNGNVIYNPPMPNSGPVAGVTYTATRTVKYTLDVQLGAPSVDITAVYPFHHKDGVSDTFTLRGRMGLFFTHQNMGLRPSTAVNGLRFSNGVSPRTNPNANIQPYANGVMSFGCQDQSLSFSRLQSVNDVVRSGLQLTSDQNHLGNIANALQSLPLLDAGFTWQATGVAQPNGGTVLSPATFQAAWQQGNVTVVKAVSNIVTLDNNGDDSSSPLKATGQNLISQLLSGVPMTFNLATWAQIVDSNGYTVDMVPACWQDDDLNGSPNSQNPQSVVALQDFGDRTPLMRFNTGVSFTFKLDNNMDPDFSSGQNWTTPLPVTVSPTSVMVDDPRFNYAPESWYVVNGPWLDNNQAQKYDGDIFMQVSDQGYMQSIYELANITRFGNKGFRNYGASRIGNMNKPSSSLATFPTSFADSLNSHLMWRTYDPFGRYDNNGNRRTGTSSRTIRNYKGDAQVYYDDGFEALGFTSEGIGFKVNPYTDSTNILRAVLANTPHDWRCAFIGNDSLGGSSSDHEWCEDSSGAQMSDQTIQDFAAAFMEGMRGEDADINVEDKEDYEDDWEYVWRNLGWYDHNFSHSVDGQQYLIDGINFSGNDRTYNTDRKFLYGFWRDCFAVKQQLFLVFVRAEPCMMGGGAAGITPPQLGARAVALVWRDPNENPVRSTLPHKTRILFYRQFD